MISYKYTLWKSYHIKLINIQLTPPPLFFGDEKLKIYSLTKFQIYKMVLLSRVTTLYIRSPELLHCISEEFCPVSP